MDYGVYGVILLSPIFQLSHQRSLSDSCSKCFSFASVATATQIILATTVIFAKCDVAIVYR